MAEHYDLLIRGGTCVLPWGEARADIGVTAGRITQLRCKYEHLWLVFHGEAAAPPAAA